MDWRDQLPSTRGQQIRDAELAPFSWFRVGGPADLLFLPADLDDLQSFLANLPEQVPVLALGVGSNVILRDGGIAGVVIRLLGRAFHAIEIDDQASSQAGTRELIVGAGALDMQIAKAAQKAGITGLEFLCGIPGTLGGALTMNAGCYGRELRDVLMEAQGVDRQGRLRRFSLDEMGFHYRANKVQDWILWTQARLRGPIEDPSLIQQSMDAITAKREAAQPIREKTGGSTFKNPDPALSGGRSAWACVDAIGMRGATRGDAQVSEKHANFLINRGAARAADIEGLGEEIIAKVKAQLGVDLHWEIKRLGRA